MISRQGGRLSLGHPLVKNTQISEMNLSKKTPAEPGGVIDPTEYLADAWLDFLYSPERHYVELAQEIEATICRLLRPITVGGFFDAFFARIVQEAVDLTLSRFLTRNTKLVAATRSEDRTAIRDQLLRSVWLALQTRMWWARSMINRGRATPESDSEESTLQACVELGRSITDMGLRKSR